MPANYDNFIVVRENVKSTRRLYSTSCDSCGIDTGYKRRTLIKSNLCRVCFNKKAHTKKIVSEETRAKMSISASDRPREIGKFKHSIETKKTLSSAQKHYCTKYGNQFTIGKSKGKHSKETISRLSEAGLGQEPKWRGRVFEYRGATGNIKMRSSYELAYAQYLDSIDIEWEYEPKYILSNGMGFCPDFRLSDGSIVEIKGFWTSKAAHKWELFKQDNPQLATQVIMKSDLLELGLEVR